MAPELQYNKLNLCVPYLHGEAAVYEHFHAVCLYLLMAFLCLCNFNYCTASWHAIVAGVDAQ